MPTKDPAATLDYTWDWGTLGWMPEGDSIASAQFMVAPQGLTATASTTGGSFPAGTYVFVVTGVNANGETGPSNEVSVTVTGSTSSVKLDWDEMEGMTDYNIYIGTEAGAENTIVGTASGTSSVVDGISGTAATPPAGIVVEASPAPSHTDTTATAWISAGVDGATYDAICRITTAQGRVDQRTMQISVADR
ncbi:hypothetical protein E2F47_22295 [Mycobacterium eburneum]|nr:hypothetical protein [Mycobacterium eburneum]TDH48899.1 hypothetical protein E2F47_22295 [Mycobacterium eburneum]